LKIKKNECIIIQMPQPFIDCEKSGGKTRTISGPNKRFGLAAGSYLHMCFKNGEMFRGEVKQKEKVGEKKT
jgi:hypothetical protein